jgi:hypothetical protein
VGGEGQTKVGLGKGRSGGAKGNSKGIGFIGRDIYRKKSGFMVIDSKPCSLFKQLEDFFGGINGSWRAAKEDQGIIRVLKYRTGLISEDWVVNFCGQRVHLKEATEDISHYNEQVGRQGVPLTEASLAVDPFPRVAIEEDRCLACLQKISDPGTPFV